MIIANMNILNSYGVDMKKDFPLSAKLPLLTKPAWREASKEEFDEFNDYVKPRKSPPYPKPLSYKAGVTSLYIYDYLYKPKNKIISIYLLRDRSAYSNVESDSNDPEVYFLEKKNGEFIAPETFWLGGENYSYPVELFLYKDVLYYFYFENFTSRVLGKLSLVGTFKKYEKDPNHPDVRRTTFCLIKFK